MTRGGRTSGGVGVGIFGGTFNPIHIGHLRAAEEVVERLGLARMLFVPSASPPHKQGSGLERDGSDVIAPARDRLAWVRLATADHECFDVDDVELARPGPSYAVDTLQTLGSQIAPEKPIFVIGYDAFAEIGTWHEPSALFTLAHFAVIPRPPAPGVGTSDALGPLIDCLPEAVVRDIEFDGTGEFGKHRSAGTWIRRVEIASLNVSATDIRGRLREGRSARYLIPDAALPAILAGGAYAARERT